MTDPTPSTATKDKPADETFGWTADAGKDPDPSRKTTTDTVSNLLGSLRDALDDLAERASPTVREVSARTAEIAAIAADKAGPAVKKAGDVASDASGKLAVRSRDWAAEVRASIAGDSHKTPAAATPAADVADAAKGAADAATDAAKDVAGAASDAAEHAAD
jgi:hypothetical protein